MSQAVFIAVPHHSELAPQSLEGLMLATGRHRYSVNTEGGSRLALMVNTGLWVCRFSESWVEEVCFTVCDAIGKLADGRFWPRCIPEDWGFSAWCAGRGLKVFASRAVSVIHHGRAGYTNARPWGEW